MRQRDRVGYVASLIALWMAMFLVGGGLRWVVVALVGVGAVAAASSAGSRRRMARVSPLLLFLGVAIVLTSLQLVPLPDALLERITPTGHELRTYAEALLGEQSAWHPISLDTAGTILELAKLCAYAMIAAAVLRIAVNEQGRVRLLSAVAGGAAAIALTGVVHYLLGATRLFGIYTPEYSHPTVLTPLLNPNHLASLMTLGAITSAGLAFHERRAPPLRVLWVFVTILCIGVELATRSRGGTLALVAGAIATTIIIVLQRLVVRSSGRSDALRVALPGAVILLCSLVLIVYFGGSEVRDELANTHTAELEDARSKYAAWSSAWTLVHESPYFGVGRGAFESSFTRVHPAAGSVTFSHLENEYMQALVDWGIVGAGALAGTLMFAVYALRRRWRGGPLTATAIGGLVALGVHSVVDFGVELPGLAVPAIFVAATLFYVPLEQDERPRRRRVARAVAIAALAGAGVLAALPMATTLDEDHRAMRGGGLEDARGSFARHPLDYLSAAQLAVVSPTAKERLAFLNLALRLHPQHPGLHRMASRLLLASGRKQQAALELRLALLGTEKPDDFVDDVLRSFPDDVLALEALPPEHPRWTRIATALTEAKREALLLAYLWKVIDVHRPLDPDIVRRALYAATKLGDKANALRAARYLLQLEPTSQSVLQLAKIQLDAADYQGALSTLAPLVEGQVTSPDHITARSLTCDARISQREWPAAQTCLISALQLPGLTLAMRRSIHARLATVEDSLGNKDRARLERELAGGRD
ncbi:MAG: O-antigen ligase family protein [Kofleriaceae bacterium]